MYEDICRTFASNSQALRPDRAVAEEHVRLLTGSVDTKVWFRAFDNTGKDNGKACKFFGTVADQWSDIERLQADGCGIFFVINEGGNTDAEITAIRSLFVDADGVKFTNHWHAEPDFVS